MLVKLRTDEALSQREMSQRLHCAPSSVVGLIDGLEDRGWLTRRVVRELGDQPAEPCHANGSSTLPASPDRRRLLSKS
jgi:hypothetical protein